MLTINDQSYGFLPSPTMKPKPTIIHVDYRAPRPQHPRIRVIMPNDDYSQLRWVSPHLPNTKENENNWLSSGCDVLLSCRHSLVLFGLRA